jgi:hypothetical protein
VTAAAVVAAAVASTTGSGHGSRFRIGRPGDVVVIGRWQCRAAFPAVLQPPTGRVWAFDSWAPAGASRPGRLVAEVPGARSLRVDPDASGCDRLVVVGPGGGTTLIAPGVHP